MVRVILPTGKMVCINEVIALCEGSINVGGSVLTMVNEPLDKSYQPTAIKLMPKANGGWYDGYIIGNMPANVLNKVVDTMLTKGYYDFRGFTYQKYETIEDVVMDGGKSPMYFCRGMEIKDIVQYGGFPPFSGVAKNGVSIFDEPFGFSDSVDDPFDFSDCDEELEDYDEYDEYNED